MQPRYVLPAVGPADTIDLDFKPKQVAAWLKRLPLSDPLQAAEDLSGYLVTANRVKMGYEVRSKMVLQLEPAIEETVTALRNHYAGAPLPLTTRLQPAAHRAQQLLSELANAYKILIIDWLNQTFHFSRKPLPRMLQRVLLVLEQVLNISYETHENVPRGLWVDLHQTYNYALRTGLAQTIPEDSATMLSVEQIYKNALLLALADPYRFPSTELPWVRDLIARFGNLAELFPAEEASGHAGIFVIEVNTDEPPRPLAWVKHPTDPRWDLLLNTTELVKHLAMIATSLRAKQDPEDMGLPAAARDPEYGVMLHRLKLSWGASVQRQAQRRRYQRGKEIEVCLGLRALHQLIGPVGAERVVAPAGAESAPALLRCQVVDDSMGGVAIRRSGGFAVPVRVGEVVGLRQGSSGWSVGLVRWFRVPTAGELYFGIQLLAPKVETVQVRRGDDGKHYPGLLLQPAPALKQSTMLLLPPGSLSPGLEVELCSQSGPRAVKLDKRLEYTSSVDVFRLAQD